jgi:histone-lysine N-methyltransferase SETMAR
MAMGGAYHPPYSPDISPCDFDLIPKVKEPLCGRRFKAIPDIIDAVGRSVRTINKTGAANGIM